MPKLLTALLLLGALPRPAACQTSSAAATAEGWAKQASSLLLYDQAGDLVSEIGLTSMELSSATVLEISGGVSPKGPLGRSRFAWVLERRTHWNHSRTKKLAVDNSFRFLGSGGQELWTSAEIDQPEAGEAVVFSGDGEILIAALSGWTASIRSYIGNTLLEAGPFPRLREISLTPNGKYASIRWYDTDKSATHTFLEIATKKRQDFDSEKFLGKSARLSDDGKVLSGAKLLFDFAASTAAAHP